MNVAENSAIERDHKAWEKRTQVLVEGLGEMELAVAEWREELAKGADYESATISPALRDLLIEFRDTAIALLEIPLTPPVERCPYSSECGTILADGTHGEPCERHGGPR